MTTIIDTRLSNLGSIKHKLGKIGVEAKVADNAEKVFEAEKLLLPGVGSFRAGMKNLNEMGLADAIKEKVMGGTPILGICLGMQLLTNHSMEGDADGLGFIDAETVKLDVGLRVPHVGWNNVKPVKESILFKGVPGDKLFYFTHSYHVVCRDEGDVAAVTDYGGDFTSAVEKDNVYGVQFHPEKSHFEGMGVIRNFVREI